MAKNNAKATLIRQQGNELYGRKKFTEALKKYNESICWAENDSEDLAIGYANRSAVFYSMEEYEFALANVALAKAHNYPQRKMQKLEAREQICRQKLGNRVSVEEEYRFNVGVVNPRIPFLSNDVHMEEVAGMGKRVVADRDFKSGDVIVQDRIMLGWVLPSEQYAMCDYCTSEFLLSLIPCPHCVSVMYCGEDCRQKSWKHCHRFECGITGKLHEVSEGTSTSYMGPRLFLYGLSLFDDDVKKMQQFCEAHPRTGSNPFSLDYVNYDPLEEFKIIHTYKMGPKSKLRQGVNIRKLVANAYFKAYQASALVKSLFTTNAAMKFMQDYFLDYTQEFPMTYLQPVSIPLVDYYCNTSSNVVMIKYGGQTIIVALQAIPKGSQVTLKLPSGKDGLEYAANYCKLISNSILADGFPVAEWKILELEHMLFNERCSDNTIRTLEKFLHKYSHLTSQWNFQPVIYAYQMTLLEIFLKQKKNVMRNKVLGP